MTRILHQICTFLRYSTLPLLIILAACNDSSSTERIPTSDGQVIVVPKDEIYYPEEADFLTNLNPVVIQRKSLKAGEIMPVATDSVYGYDRTESIDWHKAKFGKWAEKYGYKSEVCYLVSTMALFKDVPVDGNHFILQGNYSTFDSDSIGLNINTAERGFIVDMNNHAGFMQMSTVLRYVGYDIDGSAVKQTVPKIDIDKCKWKYEIYDKRDLPQE